MLTLKTFHHGDWEESTRLHLAFALNFPSPDVDGLFRGKYNLSISLYYSLQDMTSNKNSYRCITYIYIYISLLTETQDGLELQKLQIQTANDLHSMQAKFCPH